MRPKSQTRALARTGIALCALLLAVCVISFICHFDIFLGGWQVGLLCGSAHVVQDKTAPFGFWPLSCASQHVASTEWQSLDWLPRRINTSRIEIGILPLWIPLVLLTIPTAIFWRHDRRRHTLGTCRDCGYELTGNTTGTCPECGQPANQS